MGFKKVIGAPIYIHVCIYIYIHINMYTYMEKLNLGFAKLEDYRVQCLGFSV